jgi:hypothetical protein
MATQMASSIATAKLERFWTLNTLLLVTLPYHVAVTAGLRGNVRAMRASGRKRGIAAAASGGGLRGGRGCCGKEWHALNADYHQRVVPPIVAFGLGVSRGGGARTNDLKDR